MVNLLQDGGRRRRFQAKYGSNLVNKGINSCPLKLRAHQNREEPL